MKEGEQQRLFVKLIGKLIEWSYTNGYELSFGEAWRTDEQARLYATSGKGILNSLHRRRMAIDLNLFKDSRPGIDDDVYQTDSAAYKPLGNYWKTLHPLCRWGGDFSKPDGNHFSMEWEGVK